jgi:hypothetical protein
MAAVAVAVLGAGVLVAMWRLMEWPPRQHTWPDFRSGSFGDAVLLPTMTAALVLLGRRQEQVPTPRVPGLAAGIAAAVVAAAVQYQWWADPAPPTSWSFSSPHVFSPAGAWHGVFFVVMAGILAGLVVDMLAVWRVLRLVDPRRLTSRIGSAALAPLTFSFLTFSALVILDSAPSATSSSSASSLAALALASASVVGGFVWAAGPHLRRAWPRLAASLLAALVTVLLMRTWPPSLTVWVWLLIMWGVTAWFDRWVRGRTSI